MYQTKITMADYRGINTDPYSTIAGWEVSTDAGATWGAATVLPTVADGVYANGFIKDVDVDAFASFYSNRTLLNVLAGGRFNINTGVTMVGDVLHRHATGILACVYKNNVNNSYIIGDIYGSDVLSSNGGSNAANTSHGCQVVQGLLVAVGDVYSGLLAGNPIYRAGNGINSPSNTAGAFIVTGNAICQRNAAIAAASTVAFATGLVDMAKSVVNGRAIGLSAGSGAYGITVDEIQGTNNSCIVTSKFIMPTTNQPTWVSCFAKAGADVQIEIYDELGNAVICNPIAAQGQASPADVRLNTAYANGALTGTAAIPPAGAVSLGVPVDDTVGTAYLDPNVLGQYLTPQLLAAVTQ